MVGSKIGRYEITAKLGEGGMGSVWKAEDPLLGRTVALKLLPAGLADSDEARERFLREARTASALKHPGIAAVHDAGEDGGRIWIAFEYVDGETVSERAARGPLPVDEAVRIGREAAEALEHAHVHGTLHRDVTGRNVMVDAGGRAVIVDFGLALPEGASRLTRSGTAMGTAAYVAPEVIAGGRADARSDVYGLGVVVYEMLTGRLPFEGERVEAVLYAASHDKAAPPSSHRDGLPGALDSAVLRALEKDPERRFPSAGAFAEALAAVRLGRRMWTFAAAGAAAVLLAALLWLGPPWPSDARRYSSVAVLPLTNLSEDPEATLRLSDSIGETLTTRLTQLEGLRVIPWVTSIRYAGTSDSLVEVASELAVDAVVTGTFRVVGGRAQGSLSIADARDGLEVWTQQFDEPVVELIDVIRETAVQAGAALRGDLTGDERERLSRPVSASFEAFDLYLRGADALQGADPESLRTALDLFRKSVETDPELAPAHVGIGTVLTNRYYFALQSGAPNDPADLDRAEESFLRALELDPRLTRAHGGLVRVFSHRNDTMDCLRAGKRAAEEDPDGADALLVKAEAYTLCGLPDRAVDVALRVLELDPASSAGRFFLFLAYQWSGQHAEAIRAGEEFLERFGPEWEILARLGMSYLIEGREADAVRSAEAAVEQFPEWPTEYPGAILWTAGDKERGEELLDPVQRVSWDWLSLVADDETFRQGMTRLLADLPEDECPAALAQAYFIRGDTERGLDLLRLARERDCAPAWYWGHEAFFHPDTLSDPAYQEFMQETRRLQARLRAEF